MRRRRDPWALLCRWMEWVPEPQILRRRRVVGRPWAPRAIEYDPLPHEWAWWRFCMILFACGVLVGREGAWFSDCRLAPPWRWHRPRFPLAEIFDD